MRLTTYALATVSMLISANAYAACPAGTTPRGDAVEGKPVCTLKGSYLSANVTLTSDNAYVLEGDVRFGADLNRESVLNVDAGTKVYGTSGSYLVIMRGSKINANGTDRKPVVFTSLQRDNLRAGLWGGIVLNGRAPINNCKAGQTVCESISEGIKNDPPKFGGNVVDDSSGRLVYLRVEYAGFELSKDNELNGITFNGVGSGTEVDYVQVHKNADDGVEFFGGTVNVKHLLLTENDDDGLDWDMGWTGKAQFVMIEVGEGSEDMNGIEADNLKSPMDAQPRSNPTLSNVTIVNKAQHPRNFNGILLRRGTGGAIHNTIVTGDFAVACINIDDEETFRNGGAVVGPTVEQTGLKLVNSIVNCARGNNFEDKAGDLFQVSAWFEGAQKSANKLVNPQLVGRRPAENSPAVGAGITPRVDGRWQFTPVDFIGALSPYEDEDWTLNWTAR